MNASLITRCLIHSTLIAALFVPNSSSAQVDKQRLSEISRMMFVEGNSRFLLVELIKDGFLKTGISYDVQYGPTSISVNGEKVPEEYVNRYLQMMAKFEEKEKLTGTGSMRGGGINLEEISNPANITKCCPQKPSTETFQHYINMLAEDGIIDRNSSVSIEIAGSEVKVNDHLLTTPLEEIYKRHILALSGFKAQRPGDSFSILVKR